MPSSKNGSCSTKRKRYTGGFGARPFRELRKRLLEEGPEVLPKSWRNRGWVIRRITATPPWADFKKIKAIYIEAQMLTDATGILHTVDHVIPLGNERVCGLHVHYNMEIKVAAANFSKGNAWCEWHGELFDQPEQFRLFHE